MTDQSPERGAPRPFRIRRIFGETADTFTMELQSANGESGLPFAPGQFNMLYAFGMGEIPISISGDPAKPDRLVHTIRAVGTVTKAMRAMKAGDSVVVRGPMGTGWPMEAALGNDVVIVAGGIGLAPLRSVLYALTSEREKYGRVVLLFGTRTPQDIPFQRELERWRGRLDLEVKVTVDKATPAWRGNVGVVTTLIAKASFDPQSTTAFICGPEVMMRFTALELQARGVPAENIYISMERNMKCGVGLCGHCQLGPYFICKDGPVFRIDQIKRLLALREI
jgi:NAD(P)H-flavin reductase